jgi:hypothetical protein
MMANSSGDMSDRFIEAARYTLLRRLAPAIRHRLVGKLHPIGLIAEVVEGQIREAAPDLANVQDNVAKINSLSRSAMRSTASLITWLAPDEGATTTIGDGIDECLALLQTDFGVRGFSIESEVRGRDVCVSLSALRNVLTASLIAAIDSASGPANLLLKAEVSKEHALLSIHMRPTDDTVSIEIGNSYRRLGWDDVQALAGAESVELSPNGSYVEMRYCIEGVAAPASLPR